jgi:hypothetical protein
VAGQADCVLPTVVTAWAFAACVKGVPGRAATFQKKFGCFTTTAHPLAVFGRLPVALGAANTTVVSVKSFFFADGVKVW